MCWQIKRPVLHADFLVLGMSDSYQTLFRRIEAMKHVRKLTRKQIALAGCAFLILGGAALIPCASSLKKPSQPQNLMRNRRSRLKRLPQ